VSLALHAIAILGFRRLALGQHPPPEVMPIELVMTEPSSEPRSGHEPQQFTELPRDRADAAPKAPEFLSNVTSRARDAVPGGDADRPRTPDAGDARMLNLAPRDASTGSSTSPDGAKTQDQSAAGLTASRPKPGEPDFKASDDARLGMTGESDIQQPEIVDGGNVSLTGDISLSTTAWDYAPWLDRYRRQLLREWAAPQAYELGLLKDGGWAVIDVEIARSGAMLRCDLRDQQGDPSLILAAQIAVRSVNPIEPLPSTFPDPTLLLRIRMIYPKLVPRGR